MTFNRGCIQLGRAVRALVDLAVNINFLSDSAKIISNTPELAALNRVSTYSEFVKVLRSTLVYSEDYEQFDAGFAKDNIITLLYDGESVVECEFRLLTGKEKTPVWYSAKFLCADPSDDFNGRSVLVISDIDHLKQVEARADQLSKWAERDSLTGMYNKKAASTLIDAFLSGEGKTARHTILFCDLDDFKSINDTYGHQLGDVLLSSIAEKLTQTFRREDILCRIGGDEFIILMKNASGRSYVSHRADVLLDRMKQPFTLGEHRINVTMSIGVASYPECGTTYSELLQNADKAMYVSKFNGKNRYHFYSDMTSDAPPSAPAEAADDIDSVDSRSVYRARGKLSDYIFNCLYESTSIPETLPLVLQLMGTHFDLGRVAIAGFRDDVMHIIHQWNANGVKRLSRPIDYSGELRALFEGSRSCENMAMRYNDIGQTPAQVRQALVAAGIDDVCAFLHCPLLDNGVIRGYIVFFDCTAPRVWSEEERDILSYVSRLISLFVFKQQDYERTVQAYHLTDHALNGSPLSLIIVDRNTHELIYTSQKVSRESPAAVEGAICHKAIFGNDSPCEYCPMKLPPNPDNPKEARTLVHNDPEARTWVVFSAADIELDDGREACLCGRVDTTHYKAREIELEDENAMLRARLAELTGQPQ